MPFMLLGLIMDGHVSLTVTSLALFQRFVNVFLHTDSIFTAEHVLSRMVTPSHALSRINL
jgi:hypothetical protein